jgi:hypothetical protein
MVASPKGLGPEKDCAGKGQQHIQKKDPPSRQRERPPNVRAGEECSCPRPRDHRDRRHRALVCNNSQCGLHLQVMGMKTVTLEQRLISVSLPMLTYVSVQQDAYIVIRCCIPKYITSSKILLTYSEPRGGTLTVTTILLCTAVCACVMQ